MTRKNAWIMTGVALALASSAVYAGSTTEAKSSPGGTAHATLRPRAGSNAGGTITFTEQGGKVLVAAHLHGVAAGKHGFHIHEKGDCSDPEFKAAGGHFNPSGSPHGAPGDAAHHAGDLGNIDIAADGSGQLDISSTLLTVAPGPNSVVGRAVILHEKADDLKTQPTGDAGGRIGCGIVEAAPAK